MTDLNSVVDKNSGSLGQEAVGSLGGRDRFYRCDRAFHGIGSSATGLI